MICETCQALKERGEDFPCTRCNARKQGWKCSTCGSTWVYITADGSHFDGEPRHLCKPCCYAFIASHPELSKLPGQEPY